MKALSTIVVRNQASVSNVTPGGITAGGSASWTTFTPTVVAATDPNLGNGTTTFLGETKVTHARYIQLGDIVCAQYQIVFGVGATAGTGAYGVSFPLTLPAVFEFSPATSTALGFYPYWPVIGSGTVYDSVNDEFVYVLCYATGTTNSIFGMRSINRGELGPTVIVGGTGGPCTIDVGSFIEVELFYPISGYGGIVV